MGILPRQSLVSSSVDRANNSVQSTEGIVAFDTAPGAPQLQFKPMEFEVLKEHSIVQVAAGNDHFLALTTTGFVFACGRGEQNQLGRKIIARVSRLA